MTNGLKAALLACAVALAAPAWGQSARAIAAPAQLSASERDNYRAVFAALRAQDWAGAAGRLDGMQSGPLHNLARAMLYTMPGSPRVESGPLTDLLARAPELPQADDLARLARARGAESLPELPRAQRLYGLAGQPRRARPRAIRGDAVADQLEPLLAPLIRDDRPVEAEALLNSRSEELSEEARTAFRQRIAWVYYLNGMDAECRRIADLARSGPTEHAIHAEWVAGLAAWRMGDYAAAAEHFGDVAARSTDAELNAAGHYWAARADAAGAHPERVQAHLRSAARAGETFYGLLAQSALGLRQAPADMTSFTEADWHALSRLANARAAVALSEIGENDLAAELIRRQAEIGSPADHEHLIHLAARLNLTATQMYLAHNGPRGSRFGPGERYPAPSWRPTRGWRVDPALAFAHALQESQFRADAVSPVGARGLMQVRPGTAGDMARARGESFTPASLSQPQINIEFGQTYLEQLRDMASTGGLLPKVIASYNAGPAPIAEWNARYDQSDPLLYIESIPYWETRGYVPIILRNYWIYEARGGDRSTSRRALAQGLWPRFPGLPGPTAVRIPPRARQQTAMGSD
ncbi:MAG TPA: lytic transglycosylase domain-containing protein [Allosphingosinicella sp.]|nr:lytic transglycosylase domain-containing protein [Allosphingosinicella sp.]